MKTFFQPASIAVIGASSRAESLGGQIIANLLYGYQGKIYPINPHAAEIKGVRCYSELQAVPGSIDLAIIIVPAPNVPDALDACARKGIYRVIIESAGFSEVGPEGKMLQDRCTAIARAAGIRVWGPNCMGLVDIPGKKFFTFMHPKVYENGLIPGRISLIVQSGMLTAGFLADLMGDRAIGVGKACSIGNKSDVDECDILEYLLQDGDTDSIALYLESIPRGRRFMELTSRAVKPIVVLKGGKSSAGARAALSHTSSLAGNARLQDSLLSQAGITIAHDFQQMMELARALAMIPQTPKPCRAAIMTFSGGAGILSCDLLEEAGIIVADLSAQTKEKLAGVFPAWLPASNPVDLFPAFALKGPQAAFEGAFTAVVDDPQVDVIFLHFFAGLHEDFEGLKLLKKMADEKGKVIIMWVIGLREPVRSFKRATQEIGIPVHGELYRAVECLAAASGYQPQKHTTGGSFAETPLALPTEAARLLAEGMQNKIWDEFDSKRLLKECSIPVVEEQLVSTAAAAQNAGRRIGFPVVVKGLIPGQVHKTEAGLVRLGIASASELKKVFQNFNSRLDSTGRIIVQKQLPVDFELIAGFLRDDQFGPCVMFGVGGIFSELQRDVVFALAPLSRDDARSLIYRIKGKKLLSGFRGMAPINEEALADILINLGNLGAAHPEIDQIDINPLAVWRGNPVAVDATVILAGGNIANKR
jgi:acetate---CoA ligase (ADP-forming)